MGLSGGFLKRKQEIEYPQIVEDVIQMVKDIGYVHHPCEHYKGTFKGIDFDYFTINIYESENSEKEFLMYIFGETEEKYDSTFDWIIQGANLTHVINIENFHGLEDMLLKFTYEYLKKFPNDIFWDDLDWYYTKDDIEKIINRPYDKDWCYKNPKDYL